MNMILICAYFQKIQLVAFSNTQAYILKNFIYFSVGDRGRQ